MKYSLRSLMLGVLVLTPLIAGCFFAAQWILSRPRGVDLGNGIDLVYPVEE
jgi:hypothetical protein